MTAIMASRASKMRQAAVQRRRIVMLERIYIPQFAREIDRMAKQAGEDYVAGGSVQVEIGLDEHIENMQVILNSLYDDATAMGARYVTDNFRKGGFDLIEKKDVISQTVNDLLGYWLSESYVMAASIAETSRDDVRRATTKAVTDGLNEVQVGRFIEDTVGQLAPGRSRTIARTESHQAIMKSQYDIVENMDLPDYANEWASGSDGRVRKTHRKADGQLRLPGNAFQVGSSKLKYPGERGGRPGDVINCRCVVLQTFEEEDIRRAQ